MVEKKKKEKPVTMSLNDFLGDDSKKLSKNNSKNENNWKF